MHFVPKTFERMSRRFPEFNLICETKLREGVYFLPSILHFAKYKTGIMPTHPQRIGHRGVYFNHF
jgi:hypothetical protein